MADLQGGILCKYVYELNPKINYAYYTNYDTKKKKIENNMYSRVPNMFFFLLSIAQYVIDL